MNTYENKRYQYTVDRLVNYGCDRTEARIAARALQSSRSEGFFSDKEMQAINNCAAKVIESIAGERHESFY